MTSRIQFRLLYSSLLIALMLLAGIAPASAQGRGGGRGGGGGGGTEIDTVRITIGVVANAQLLDDGDPVYEDRRMEHLGPGLGDACVTSAWNGSLVFSHFDRGANSSSNPLFSQCNTQRPADARKINLRFPLGSCECNVLAPGAGDGDADGFCDVDIVDINDGAARIRANGIFKKKARNADFNLLFDHGGTAYEVQYEGTAPIQGSGDLRSLIATGPNDTFRLVEVGGTTMCSGFTFPLDITFERISVTVPDGS